MMPAMVLAAVRRWGGVLEHPEASAAWRAFDLNAPPWGGAWVSADFFGGWTCCVEQGKYEHRARKATWLYASGVRTLPSLEWGASSAAHRLDGCGFHTTEERIARLGGGKTRRQWMADRGIPFERLNGSELAATPIPFRDVLLSIARSAQAAP